MMNFFRYKHFIRTVQYSEADQVFYEKKNRINDLVTFEGVNLPELRKAFKESIEDYLKHLSVDKTTR